MCNENFKDTLFLKFILKQHFVIYKIVHDSLQFFEIFHNSQLIISVNNVK